MKTVLITGGTGFIGQALVKHLSAQAYAVIVLSREDRHQQHNSEQLNYITSLQQIDPLQKIDIVINLAGEPLNAKRWNEQHLQNVIDSRTSTTKTLVHWLKESKRSVDLFISGSAIGWYGHWQNEVLTESSSANNGFSHNLCRQWEQEAKKAEAVCKRIVLLRIGIVLEQDGGPLAAMLPAFKMGLGGKMGAGEQYWSWIHRGDLISLIQFIIEQINIEGAINATAPNPLPQAEFAKILAQSLNRPSIFPMPGFIASLVMGGFADEILLKGQNVIPAKAIEAGFNFNYPNLKDALENIFKQ